MALTVYATSADLATWLEGNAPSGSDRLLRSATFVVAKACDRNPYQDSPTADDAAVLRDATCAQVSSWITLGITPDSQGVGAGPIKKQSLGPGDIERDTTGQAAALTAAATSLCAEAQAILTAGLLISLPVPVGSDCDWLPSYGLDLPYLYGVPADWPSDPSLWSQQQLTDYMQGI